MRDGTKGESARQGRLFAHVGDVREQIRALLGERMRTAVLDLVYDLFRQETEKLCGRGKVRKGMDLCHRGGSERGSIYLEGQRAGVVRPRVRKDGREVTLESYAALQDYDVLCQDVTRLLVRGVSTRDYGEALRQMEGGLGLSRSSVSRAFEAGSLKALDEINGRDLKGHAWAALFIDGQEFQGVHIVAALGVTQDGRKVLLGLREGATENTEVVRDLLASIRDRGFDSEGAFLAILDGAKALAKGVRQVFGEKALIQRCQVHKKRNVLSHLPEGYHAEASRRLSNAWGIRTAQEARRELKRTVEWLGEIQVSASRSLEEGLEETLTVHGLGLPDALRRTFSTTNLMESVFSSVAARGRRVTNWRKGQGQALRWAAAAMKHHEERFRRIIGHKQMPLLVEALKARVLNSKGEVA